MYTTSPSSWTSLGLPPPSHPSVITDTELSSLFYTAASHLTRCLMTVWRILEWKGTGARGKQTKCLHQEAQGPGPLQPLNNKQQLLHQRLPLRLGFKSQPHESVSNVHLKSSIQKITKSWPFIPLDPSHCNENMYLTEKTLSLPPPRPLSFFSSPFLWGLKILWFISALPNAAVNYRPQRLPNPEGSRQRTSLSSSRPFSLQPTVFVPWLLLIIPYNSSQAEEMKLLYLN